MKHLIFSLLILSVTACGKQVEKLSGPELFNEADFPNVNGTVYGKWRQDNGITDKDGVKHSTNIYLNDQGMVGLVEVCSAWNYDVKASATVPGNVTAKTIEINSDHSVYEKGKGAIEACELVVSKRVSPYKYRRSPANDNLDRLFITLPDNEEATFTRMID